MYFHRWVYKFLLASVIVIVSSNDEPSAQTQANADKFKTCADSNFCRKLRDYKPESSPYRFLLDSFNISRSKIQGKIVNNETQETFLFSVQFLMDSTVRLTMNEEKIYRRRFQPVQALVKEPSLDTFEVVEKKNDKLILETITNKIIIMPSPAKLEIYTGTRKNEQAIVVNDFGRLHMEYNQQEEGLPKYEEKFNNFVDSKPYGPMAVALDFSFPAARHMYGLSQHAEGLPLNSTKNTEPYRLFNVDDTKTVPFHKKSMYGSVPFVIAHSVNHTVGIFWLNSAETWIDIDKPEESSANVMNTYFMSETGMLDVFFILGPNFGDVIRQYTALTGTAPIPPYFALGYHQRRWNYVHQDDVSQVQEVFDKNKLPLDAIWLNTEYTDQKKYFTWDPVNFKDPGVMIANLTQNGRKLVVILDPHIKRDPQYEVYKEGSDRKLFVKNKNGTEFVGICWPKESCWFDYLNPEGRDYYSSLYEIENFKGSTKDVFIWNDMNEPSVFSGPEKTLPRDSLYFDNWEHRDVHNIYGLLQVMSTYEGLLRRSNNKLRPFILSRSHFAGTQRYAAIWTGDNLARWDHLKISIPMCLTSALCGISLCGADIGDFTEEPDEQLLTRWFQAGSYLPFFQEHSILNSKRREPYVFNSETKRRLAAALSDRQSWLPFWYTLSYEHSKTGVPLIRPVVLEFPKEVETFNIDNAFLVGGSLLIRPVTEADVKKVDVYFPGQNEIWYSLATFEQFTGNGLRSIDVDLDDIPVYCRGGHILPRRKTIRKSALETLNDPITLLVALDEQNTSSGYLYIDDGQSFDYKTNNSYSYLEFEFSDNKLTCRFENNSRFPAKLWVESISIFQIANVFDKAVAFTLSTLRETQLVLTYNNVTHSYTVSTNETALPLTEEWTITLT